MQYTHQTLLVNGIVFFFFFVQASIYSREDPSFRLDADETSQGKVFGTPMLPDKPENPEFSSGPCKKRPG